jgi:hypothetical protein
MKKLSLKTEQYGCGNGILSFEDSKFHSKSDSEYIIEFNGASAGNGTFRVKAIYQLTKVEKGGYFLYLKKIIEDKREPLHAD